jgi:hypothetical protein
MLNFLRILITWARVRKRGLDRIRALGFDFAKEDVVIARVGKQSPAHRAAIRVTRRQVRADRAPSAQELVKFC